jgi:hypothetical protein
LTTDFAIKFSSSSFLISREFVEKIGIFGTDEYNEYGIQDTTAGNGLKNLLGELRGQVQSFMFLSVYFIDEVRAKNDLLQKLIEDKGSDFGAQMSYFEFYSLFLKGISKTR